MGLDRINSGTGGGPKHTPTPTKEQKLKGAANPMPQKGSTPQARQYTKNNPTPDSSF